MRKFLPLTKFRSKKNERGQTIVEYILLLLAILTVFIGFIKPAFKGFQDRFGAGFKAGIFAKVDDETSGSFYYFPVK